MAELEQVNTSTTRASSRRASSKRGSVKPTSSRASTSRTSTSRASTSRASTSRASTSRKSTSRKSTSRISTGGRKTHSKQKKSTENILIGVLASFWTYSALVWTFLLTWCAQIFLNKIEKSKRKSKRMTESEFAAANGEIFHGMVSKLVLDANPFWRRTITSDMPLEEHPTAIYMPNHISFSDPFVLCGVVPEAKAVAISNLWDNPVLGTVFRNNGDLPVFFEKLEDGTYGKHTEGDTRKKLIADAAEVLANGVNIAVFPEGEISPTGELLPMKYGFFKLALATGTPIIPIGMWGNQDAWGLSEPKNGVSVPKAMLGAGDIQARIGLPIATDDGITLEELVVKVTAEIDRLTKSLPNYTLDIYNKN